MDSIFFILLVGFDEGKIRLPSFSRPLPLSHRTCGKQKPKKSSDPNNNNNNNKQKNNTYRSMVWASPQEKKGEKHFSIKKLYAKVASPPPRKKG